MDGEKLKQDLVAFKERLSVIETDLRTQIEELSDKEAKWTKMEQLAEEIRQREGNRRVTFNVYGKKFTTTVNTLLGTRDTLLYKLIISQQYDYLNEEVFFESNPKMFPVILDFLRTKKINLKRFRDKESKELQKTAQYFEIIEILDMMGYAEDEIQFERVETAGPYFYNTLIGDQDVEVLHDRNLNTGICTVSPGWILIELNAEYEIDEIQIGGYRGNPSYWSVENGYGASIKFSTDNKEFTSVVGTIPTGYGTVIKVISIKPTKAKFIKFEHNTNLGIGYLGLRKYVTS
jgi:hypothetical protein